MKMGAGRAEALAWLREAEGINCEPFALWPCNIEPLNLFRGLRTQWRRYPMGGVAGLDYAALPAYFQLKGLKRSAWKKAFEDLQAMEAAVLPILHQK